MGYYAVTRTNSDDELKHWKYIKKKKINGKWRYYYDKSELDKYDKGYVKTASKNDSRNQDHITVKRYRKTNDLFSSKTTEKSKPKTQKKYSIIKKKETKTTITYKQGKLDRIRAKGEKYIFDKFLKNKKTKKPGSSEISKLVSKGKKHLDKILNKDDGKGKSKDKKKNKYVEKVKMPNGKTRYFYSKDEYNAYLKRQEYQKNEPDFMKKVKKIDKNTSMLASEDMAATNPKYDPYNDETSSNCFKCSIAYELRRRGYDVEAAPFKGVNMLKDPQAMSSIDKYFKKPKVFIVNEDGSVKQGNANIPVLDVLTFNSKLSKPKVYTGEDVKKSLEKNNPPNSRGMINVRWDKNLGGGGHSMVYEVNSKGKVIIRDTQTNKLVDIDDLAIKSDRINFARLDNLEMKKEVLRNVRKR